jgi:DNA-binding MurR/RpiR family transcriptional regulator
MAQVAQACGVSDTTVLRFCRYVGFQGYTDLKLSIARDLTSPTQVIHDNIAEGDPPAVIARKVFYVQHPGAVRHAGGCGWRGHRIAHSANEHC